MCPRPDGTIAEYPVRPLPSCGFFLVAEGASCRHRASCSCAGPFVVLYITIVSRLVDAAQPTDPGISPDAVISIRFIPRSWYSDLANALEPGPTSWGRAWGGKCMWVVFEPHEERFARGPPSSLMKRLRLLHGTPRGPSHFRFWLSGAEYFSICAAGGRRVGPAMQHTPRTEIFFKVSDNRLRGG